MNKVTVEFLDTTLRDGAQSLPNNHQFDTGIKLDTADKIAQLGVSVIEAGFPATASDAEEVREVAESVGNQTYEISTWNNTELDAPHAYIRQPVIAGLSRTVMPDIEATWDAVSPAARPRIHTFVSTDAEHMAAKFPNKTPDEVLQMGRTAVAFAREISTNHTGATVEFSAEAASTTDISYLEKVVKSAIDAGADVINLPDTVGQRDPFQMQKFYKRAIQWVMESNPNVVVSAHNHNDLGLAVANSYSLVRAAAKYAEKHDKEVRTQIETTICGLGERAGNADIFPMTAQLFKFSPEFNVPVEWEFNPIRSVATAASVLSQANLTVPRQNPIVGRDTNRHRSGIHSDGIIKGGHQIYSPYDPTFWGHSDLAVHEEGKYQGANGRRHIQK